LPHSVRPSTRPHVPVLAKERTDRPECLLTVDETAQRLGTGVRFIRRLIAERRIPYVKLGKHVRIAETALSAYIAERTVEPLPNARSRYGKAV
jgi:excisionase family DNA binding protein